MRIDFVSDVVCPWCAIGMASLQQALREVGDAAGPIEIHVQPFELNPAMAVEGEPIVEHLQRKYGIDAAQIRANQQAIAERGRGVGFTFGTRDRIWNTFDAHRLLHWAGVEAGTNAALRLKQALLQAYHGEGRNPSDAAVLLDVVQACGLDRERAAQVLAGDTFARDVREREQAWQQQGIQAVPAVVLDGRWLVSGGQPPEVYVQAIRQAAAQSAQDGQRADGSAASPKSSA